MSELDEKIKKQQEEEKEKLLAEARKPLEDALKEKEKEIETLKSKDTNFSAVRKQLEEKEKEIADAKKQLVDKDNEMVTERRNKTIESMVGNDAELKKTVEFHYNKFSGEAKTPEEIEERVKEALVLATGGKSQGAVKQIVGSAGGKKIDAKGANSEIDPEVKKWGDEFNKYGAGIKDEDLAKRANKK